MPITEARNMDGIDDEVINRSLLNENYVENLKSKWAPVIRAAQSKANLKWFSPRERKLVEDSMAIVLENEANYLKKSNSKLMESTATADIATFTKYIFPIIRDLYPGLLAHHLVNVQPMTAAVGAVFYKNNVYGVTKGSVTVGQNTLDNFNRHYSSEYIDLEQLAVGDGVNYGGAGAPLAVSLGFAPVRPYSAANGFRVFVREYNGAGVVVQDAYDNGAGVFIGAVVGGTINYATGSITNFRFTNPAANGNTIVATYSYNMELNPNIGEVNLKIDMESIVARPRKIKFRYSPEAIDDLKSFYGYMGEAEFVNDISQQMLLETDREIVMDLADYAAVSGTTTTYNRAVQATDGSDQGACARLMGAISDISQKIHQLTHRAPANWILTSAQVIGIFERLMTHGDYRNIFTPDGLQNVNSDYVVQAPTWGTVSSSQGIVQVGVLNKKWRTYQDPYYTSNKLLLGLKTDSFLDAGYVWAPYVLLQMTATFEDPNDFSLKKGFRMRYGTKRIRPEFYGEITVNNMTII